jgi:hypothetical protein
MTGSLYELKGNRVEVLFQGLAYTGKLIGFGETDVYLQTLSHRVVLPMSGITEIRALQKRGS